VADINVSNILIKISEDADLRRRFMTGSAGERNTVIDAAIGTLGGQPADLGSHDRTAIRTQNFREIR
jgi:hypothetical protein